MSVGRLKLAALVTSVLMIAAAISATLGYVLAGTEHHGPSSPLYVPQTSFGVLPFVLAPILMIPAVWRAAIPGGSRSPAFVTQVRMVTGFGLLPMVIGGLSAGIGLGFYGIEPNTPAAVALVVYQVTFLAALLADVVLLVLALRVKPLP